MRKAITPIIAIVLLISMTVVASAIAFVWVNSVQSSLEQKVGANVENAPGVGCTKLNLIAVRGDKAIVQNVGCDTVSNVTVLINGHLTNYTLDEPIAPGESAVITYSPQQAGEDLTVSIVGSWGETTMSSPAELNTEEAGFTSGSGSSSGSQPTNPLHTTSASIVEFDGGLKGYCNAYSDDENNILRYNYSWKVNNNVVSSGVFFNKYYLSLTQGSTCAILNNNSLLCWGDNSRGQLANGSAGGYSAIPKLVDGFSFDYLYSAGTFGGRTFCGILDNGSAVCWGYNGYGEVGDGSSTDKYLPTQIYGDYEFKVVEPSWLHSCGLLHDNKLLCWGDNGNGQLGDGTTTDRLVPTYVDGNYEFEDFGVAPYHTCGILTNGSALCWGANNYGQLGDGTTTESHSPVFVDGNYIWSDVELGLSYACGILTNGSALCWGSNSNGKLGNGSVGGYSTSPTFVSGNYNWSHISAGYEHTCGILTNGSALCWGDNGNGQLGDGTTTDRSSPVFVSGDYIFSNIVVGMDHTCGILTNGSAMCWGNNNYGQLGNGSAGGYSKVPVFVSGDYVFMNNTKYWNSSNYISSLSHSKYSKGDSVVFECNVLNHQFESNSTNSSKEPTKKLYVSSVNVVKFSDYMAGYCNARSDNSSDLIVYNISWKVGGNTVHSRIIYKGGIAGATESSSYAILPNGSVLTWGYNSYGQLGNGSIGGYTTTPIFVDSEESFDYIISYGAYVCGILTNGSAMCWGYNGYGGLGDGTTTNRPSPVFVSGNYEFSDIDPHSVSTCGSLKNGSIACWGRNQNGQLGVGDTSDRHVPTFISGNYNASSVGEGWTFSLAIMPNGTLMSWGYNAYGQLGDGTTATRNVAGYTSGDYTFSRVSGGNNFACGILTNGSALCWGQNTYGKLGVGDTSDRHVPTFVKGDYEFVHISCGGDHTCGILTNGSALCWGRNAYGQVGDGTNSDRSNPTFVSGNYRFVYLYAGSAHTCGILDNGSAVCWGAGGSGRLGNGDTANSNVPVFVDTDYVFPNNSYYWNSDVLISRLPATEYSSGDNVEFKCEVYTYSDTSNKQFYTIQG